MDLKTSLIRAALHIEGTEAPSDIDLKTALGQWVFTEQAAIADSIISFAAERIGAELGRAVSPDQLIEAFSDIQSKTSYANLR